MKFNDTSYEDYINNTINCNLHPQLLDVYKRFPKNINDLKNLIFYGPSGTGKYSQCLYILKKYSPSSLKYEKKANIVFNKEPYYFKISDIHYEVDMSLLGCNSKQLWHEIFMLIVDIITTKQNKCGIILCKNFHTINNELLELFYSYMQQTNKDSYVKIIFFIITEEYSFINDNILNCCNTINIPRPPKTHYCKILNNNNINNDTNNNDIDNNNNNNNNINNDTNNNNNNNDINNNKKCNKIAKLNYETKAYNITNIKSIHNNRSIHHNIPSHKLICDKILHNIIHYNEINLLQFRELMYDILIYEINIYNAIWYILEILINKKKYITNENVTTIMIKTFEFLKYYNNNYRPIFHLENYFLFICEQIAPRI